MEDEEIVDVDYQGTDFEDVTIDENIAKGDED